LRRSVGGDEGGASAPAVFVAPTYLPIGAMAASPPGLAPFSWIETVDSVRRWRYWPPSIIDGRRDRTGIATAEGVASSLSSRTGNCASDEEALDGMRPTLVAAAGEYGAPKIALERRLKVA
jgi:hypothetical protein